MFKISVIRVVILKTGANEELCALVARYLLKCHQKF